MLSYHTEIQSDPPAPNTLYILARGLGVHYSLTSLIRTSLTPQTLILGLNIPRNLATTLIYPTLIQHPHAHAELLLPRFISADYSVKDRSAVYTTAGFVVVTPAILVHDLLHGVLPADRVGGIVIHAAETVKERSNYHFAMTLFRKKNRQAFIKAFSEAPTALSGGFHRVEKVMRMLYLSRLSLWPRFHTTVRDAFKNHVPDLIDLSIPLTERMQALHNAFSDVIKAVLADLRNASHALDYSEIFREQDQGKETLVVNFDDVVRRQLDGSICMRNPRVRGLLSDLTTLRTLLREMFELNAVSFYQRIVTVRATVTHGANWLVRQEAQRAVLLARSRVWLNRRDGVGVRVVPNLETFPKWGVLTDVLREIRSDVQTAGPSADVGRILVLVKDQRTVDELREVMEVGAEGMMERLFERVFPTVAARVKEAEGKKQVTLTQVALPEEQRRPLSGSGEEEFGLADRERGRRKRKRPRAERDLDQARVELEECFREVKSEKSTQVEILLWCVEWVDLQGRGHRVLDEYRPAFVVMYSADLALVRQVEVYKAMHPGRPVRLYILAYDDALDEERFRYASEREKGAFKSLIRERATMTVHVNQDGREPEEDFTQALLDSVDAEQGYGQRGLGEDRDSRLTSKQDDKPVEGSKVLVDTRELRSSLPMLLYQSSLTIVPLTLEVGDFILSKNIGIERKSVSDLYSSFASGRLFNQAEALCRHYKYPCLLIELDSDKPLSLTATDGGVPSELLATSITSKMVLLMQQFPSFRLLWAKGPHDASELFATLKVNEEEPDVEVAASLGVDSKEQNKEDFNPGPKALLRSLPGVDSQNMPNVMRNVKSVADLMVLSEKEMATLLGSTVKAKALYEFVNEQPGEALAAL